MTIKSTKSTKKKSVKKALNSSNQIVDKKEVVASQPKNRPERIPLSQLAKLAIPAGIKEEGFAYRYIRDTADRVEAFKNAWWVPVCDGAGRPIRKPSGASGHLLLYKIEQKYYEEDLREKQKRPIQNLVQNAKLAQGDKYSSEYIPEGQEGVVVINN